MYITYKCFFSCCCKEMFVQHIRKESPVSALCHVQVFKTDEYSMCFSQLLGNITSYIFFYLEKEKRETDVGTTVYTAITGTYLFRGLTTV